MKEVARASSDKSRDDALQHEQVALRRHMRSFDFQEGLQAFAEKRARRSSRAAKPAPFTERDNQDERYLCSGRGHDQVRSPARSSVYDMVGEAVGLALKDAGVSTSDIGAAYYATATNGIFQGQTAIPGPIAMRRVGIEGVPVFTVENACASGSSAFNLATLALKAGQCDIALAVGAEKMNIADKAKMFSAFDGGWDVSTVEQNKSTLLAMGEGVTPPPGTMSDRPYSVFMDVYAALCRYHMKTYGTTQRQIAAVAAKNHKHSVHNPLAQFQKDFSIDEVLASPPIAYPLTTLMCSPISDGAPPAVLCNAAGLKRLGGAGGGTTMRAVKVLASVIQTGSNRRLDERAKDRRPPGRAQGV
jgi:acetyl-CoA acetyltransferase